MTGQSFSLGLQESGPKPSEESSRQRLPKIRQICPLKSRPLSSIGQVITVEDWSEIQGLARREGVS